MPLFHMQPIEFTAELKNKIRPDQREFPDYVEKDPTTGAVAVEMCGTNYNRDQEDALLLGTIPGFDQLSPENRQRVFENTLWVMQQRYGTEETAKVNGKQAGSTANIATAWIKIEGHTRTLYASSAQLGDSESYISVIGKDGQVKHAIRLNKNLHNPNDDNPAEIQRVSGSGRFVVFGKVMGMLAVSRSVGDPDVLTKDGDHIVEVDHMAPIELADGDQVYLFGNCDGFVESADRTGINATKIAEVIAAHPGNLALAMQTLMAMALKASRDNISIGAVPVVPGQVAQIATFDGHGGSIVSKNLKKHFYAEFELQTQLALTRGNDYASVLPFVAATPAAAPAMPNDPLPEQPPVPQPPVAPPTPVKAVTTAVPNDPLPEQPPVPSTPVTSGVLQPPLPPPPAPSHTQQEDLHANAVKELMQACHEYQQYLIGLSNRKKSKSTENMKALLERLQLDLQNPHTNNQTRFINFAHRLKANKKTFQWQHDPQVGVFIKRVLVVAATVLASIPTLGIAAGLVALCAKLLHKDALHFWRRKETESEKFKQRADTVVKKTPG